MNFSRIIKKNFIFKIKAAILIALFILVFYLILSNGSYFIEVDGLRQFSFDLSDPQNILSFIVIHTGYIHLLVNVVSFIAFAILVELTLSSVDVFFIFFLSQIGAALIFCFLNPDKTLIGASGGVSGLMAAYVIMKPVKAIITVALLVLSLNFVFVPLIDYSFYLYKQNILNEQTDIERDLNEAVAEGDVNAVIDLNKSLQESKEKVVKIEESERLQKQTTTDFWIHGYGGFLGVLYVFLFRRNKVKNAARGIHLYKEKIRRILRKD